MLEPRRPQTHPAPPNARGCRRRCGQAPGARASGKSVRPANSSDESRRLSSVRIVQTRTLRPQQSYHRNFEGGGEREPQKAGRSDPSSQRASMAADAQPCLPPSRTPGHDGTLGGHRGERGEDLGKQWDRLTAARCPASALRHHPHSYHMPFPGGERAALLSSAHRVAAAPWAAGTARGGSPRDVPRGALWASGQDCGPPSPSARGSARVSERASWSCMWGDESFHARGMDHTLVSGLVTHLHSQQEQGGWSGPRTRTCPARCPEDGLCAPTTFPTQSTARTPPAS